MPVPARPEGLSAPAQLVLDEPAPPQITELANGLEAIQFAQQSIEQGTAAAAMAGDDYYFSHASIFLLPKAIIGPK
jgi:hypothetical protein